MGGFSLEDMQAWDNQGRKKGRSEKLNEVLAKVMKQLQQNKKQEMEGQKHEMAMQKGGFTPAAEEKKTGLGGLLSKIMGGGSPQYEYTGAQSPLDTAKTDYFNAGAQGKLAGGGMEQDKIMKMADQIAKSKAGKEDYDFATLQEAIGIAQSIASTGQVPSYGGLPEGYSLQNSPLVGAGTQNTADTGNKWWLNKK